MAIIQKFKNMTESLEIIDWISITLLLVFAITGLFNGFIKEIFSAMAWILSLAIAWLYGPLIFPYVDQYVDSESVKNIISFIILFVLSFVVLKTLGNTGEDDSDDDFMFSSNPIVEKASEDEKNDNPYQKLIFNLRCSGF